MVDMAAAWNSHYRELEFIPDNRDMSIGAPGFTREQEMDHESLYASQEMDQRDMRRNVNPREINGEMVLPVLGLDGYPELYPVKLAEMFPLVTWEQWESF